VTKKKEKKGKRERVMTKERLLSTPLVLVISNFEAPPPQISLKGKTAAISKSQ
jgi:hypothetical protein